MELGNLWCYFCILKLGNSLDYFGILELAILGEVPDSLIVRWRS